MRFRQTMPLALGLLVAACAPDAQETAETTTQEYASPAEASELIATLAQNYEEHYNAGHADMVADMFTGDAIIQGSTSEAVMGREGIVAYNEQFMASMSPMLTINPIEQKAIGDWVLDRGSYSNVVAPEGAEPATLTGNYLSLSKRDGDALALHRLAVNFDGPPPMPMPAPEPIDVVTNPGAPLADFIASYEEHYNAGHASVVAEHWTEDGIAMYAERPESNGRAEIEAVVQEFMDAMSPQLTIMSIETVMIDEGIAVDRGAFRVEGTVDGQGVTRTGRYMMIVKQGDDGAWKIHWGLSNIAPMPMM